MSTLIDGLSDGSLAANFARAGTAAARTAAFSKITLRQSAPDTSTNTTSYVSYVSYREGWSSCKGDIRAVVAIQGVACVGWLESLFEAGKPVHSNNRLFHDLHHNLAGPTPTTGTTPMQCNPTQSFAHLLGKHTSLHYSSSDLRES